MTHLLDGMDLGSCSVGPQVLEGEMDMGSCSDGAQVVLGGVDMGSCSLVLSSLP